MMGRHLRICMFLGSVLLSSNSESCIKQCPEEEIAALPLDTIHIQVNAFGVIGDSLTDNSDSMIALVSHVLTHDSIYYVLHFAPGRYCYTDNTWLSGLTFFTIEGNGSEFQNIIEPVPHGEDCQTLSLRGPHRKRDPVFRYHYNNGSRFEQIASDKIQLLETIQDFNCGDLVLLTGFEQQHSGYPPNPRYFEYKLVTGMTTAGNILELDTTLNNQYDIDWGDYAWGDPGRELKSGSPRILNLSHTDYTYPRKVEIRNATFLPNPNCSISDALVIPGEEVVLRNVHLDIVFPHCARVFRFIGGSINRIVEFDKIVDSIYLQNVSIHRTNQEPGQSRVLAATSVNYLALVDCVIEGPIRVSPRHLTVYNTTIILDSTDTGMPAIDGYDGVFPIHSVRIDNVEIVSDTEQIYSLLGFSNLNELILPSPTQGQCIAIPDNETYRTSVLRSLDIGTIVRSPELEVNGVVSRMYQTTETEWCIEIEWDHDLNSEITKIIWSQTNEIHVQQTPLPQNVTLFRPEREILDTVLEHFQKVTLISIPHND